MQTAKTPRAFDAIPCAGSMTREEDEANARLIAAAPEMLAALDALCDQLQGARIYLDGLIDLSAALAAIEMATGTGPDAEN